MAQGILFGKVGLFSLFNYTCCAKIWLDVNKLSLNIDKTNHIIFKSPQHSSSETVSIRIGSLPVKRTSYIEFLDILLDETLSWKYHLTELSKELA